MIDPKSVPDAHGLSVDSLRGTEFHIRTDMVGDNGKRRKNPDTGLPMARAPLSAHESGALLLKGIDVPADTIHEAARDYADTLRPRDDANDTPSTIDPYLRYTVADEAPNTFAPPADYPLPFGAAPHAPYNAGIPAGVPPTTPTETAEEWARRHGWTPPAKTDENATPPPFGQDVP